MTLRGVTAGALDGTARALLGIEWLCDLGGGAWGALGLAGLEAHRAAAGVAGRAASRCERWATGLRKGAA